LAPSPSLSFCLGYIEQGPVSKTEAGWLIGIFFAAYVPVRLALTDRVMARRIYLIGTAPGRRGREWLVCSA
jgi:hypothetical protein